MAKSVQGLHHITALTANAQANHNFYSGILGLKLLKQTVNQDELEVLQVYYGNELGRPGTLLSFFVYPGLEPGRRGKGQVEAIGFSVPQGALAFWREHLEKSGITCSSPQQRFEESYISFCDPEGLPLELVASEGDYREPIPSEHIPEAYAIRGLYQVGIALEGAEDTLQTLKQYLDHTFVAEAGNRARFSPTGKPGDLVDLICLPDKLPGRLGTGTVHHVAFKTPAVKTLESLHKALIDAGLNVSLIADRKYFRAFYFRELEGVLWKIATVPPGFTVDEPASALGQELKLPPEAEHLREKLADFWVKEP